MTGSFCKCTPTGPVCFDAGTDTPDARVDVAETGADGGHCGGRTNLRATVTVHIPDGSTVSCATAAVDAGKSPPTDWVGKVTGSDASSLSVSVCTPGASNVDDAGATGDGGTDAGCVPGVLRIEAVAPGLDLTQFPRTWVRVQASVSRFWVCSYSLEITTADPIDGSSPQGPAGRLLLAVSDGGSGVGGGSSYHVARVRLGCEHDGGCNVTDPNVDDYAFDFSRPGETSAPLRVYMGDAVTWKSSGGNFTVHNLRSYDSGYCDDYWNWAYTIYADPP